MKTFNELLDTFSNINESDDKISLTDYKNHVHKLGYKFRTTKRFGFKSIPKYTHPEHGNFNTTDYHNNKHQDNLEKHKELLSLRKKHDGKVVDGNKRVII